VLYIESLEIDDQILDKIESKHSVTFRETTDSERQLYKKLTGGK